MELIDRYLHAVKFWLPKGQADDIVAELAEDIQTELEVREHELGRELTHEEIAALLRKLGRPVVVANRYLPQQHLIGPLFFPIYKLVLKIVALCYLIPWALAWLGLIASSGNRDFHGWAAHFADMWGSLWLNGFVAAGVVTIVFAILERSEARSHMLECWDPDKLPPVRDQWKISRACAAFEIAANLFASVWWAANLSSPVVLDRPFARVEFSGTWTYFYWGFLAIMVASVFIAAVSLIDPHWTMRRAVGRLLIDGTGAILFCWLLTANIVTAISTPDLSPDKAAHLVNAVNLWAARMLPVGLILGAVTVATDIFRIWRRRTGKAGNDGRVNGRATGPTACASPLR